MIVAQVGRDGVRQCLCKKQGRGEATTIVLLRTANLSKEV